MLPRYKNISLESLEMLRLLSEVHFGNKFKFIPAVDSIIAYTEGLFWKKNYIEKFEVRLLDDEVDVVLLCNNSFDDDYKKLQYLFDLFMKGKNNA